MSALLARSISSLGSLCDPTTNSLFLSGLRTAPGKICSAGKEVQAERSLRTVRAASCSQWKAREDMSAATSAVSLQGMRRMMRTSFCCLRRLATASLVEASRYSLAAVMRSTSRSFLPASSLMRRCLTVFLDCFPLAMAFVLPTRFWGTNFLAALDPLNFLFFCLLALATRGIVDRNIITKCSQLSQEIQTYRVVPFDHCGCGLRSSEAFLLWILRARCLQLEVKERMLSGSNDHLFLDISTIDCRDTNISFSVEHLLSNQYYPARPHPHPQKIHHNRNKDTPSRQNGKTKEPNTPRALRKEGSKLQQRQSRQPSKHRDALDDKDTYDSSQTVKIVHAKPTLKEVPAKKGTKPHDCAVPTPTTPTSNKFQPFQQSRSRSKSNASLQANRRLSQAKQDFAGKAVSSNISLTRNPSLEKMRSETHRAPTEEAKARNEHIVRNDYFDEKAGGHAKGADGGKLKTTSTSKKLVAVGKKGKKVLATQGSSGSQWEKLNPKSPRLKK